MWFSLFACNWINKIAFLTFSTYITFIIFSSKQLSESVSRCRSMSNKNVTFVFRRSRQGSCRIAWHIESRYSVVRETASCRIRFRPKLPQYRNLNHRTIRVRRRFTLTRASFALPPSDSLYLLLLLWSLEANRSWGCARQKGFAGSWTNRNRLAEIPSGWRYFTARLLKATLGRKYTSAVQILVVLRQTVHSHVFLFSRYWHFRFSIFLWHYGILSSCTSAFKEKILST